MFADKPFWQKMLITLIVIFVGFCLTMFVFATIAAFIYPQEVLSGQIPTNVYMLRVLQTLQSFFVFIFPTLLIAFWFSFDPKEYLFLTQRNKLTLCLLVILSGILFIPFINWLAYWNMQMKLPEALTSVENWMMDKEKEIEKVMTVLLQMDSFGIFLFNLFLIAFLAAIGEEFLFRGIIQRLFITLTRNFHASIWLSAFIFSVIHMQFYGFLPRLLLGAYFGYLLWWTKSLWIPVLAHFIHNAIAVLISYLEQQKLISSKWETIGANDDIWLVVCSFVIFGLFFWIIYRQRINHESLE